MAITVFLSRSPELLNRSLGVQPLWDMVLIPASSLQLIWGSEPRLLNRRSWGLPLLGAGSLYSILSPINSNFLCTKLYYCFTPTQFNLSTVKIIPLILSTRCTCYLHWYISYFDSSAGVNMQQLYLIVKVFVTQAKFLSWSGYFIVINCTYTFHTNVFGCFCYPWSNLKW